MIWLVAGIVIAALGTLLFSSLTYALRDFSRARLEHYLVERQRPQRFEWIVEHQTDLIFVTASCRLLANILIVLGMMQLFETYSTSAWLQYTGTLAGAGLICLVFSVAVPSALALYLAEAMLALSSPLLYALWVALAPMTKIMHWFDSLVRRAVGRRSDPEPEHIEKDILSVVEEGEEEGVVDAQEREMIESVIEFHDIEVSQTMTARPEIVAIELAATLEEVRRTIEESGHSRIPVYDGTLDHIIGILYARDLLKHLGRPPGEFDIRSAMRPAMFVPESKPVRDLLLDFRLQKVHIAIVLDEYGGTAGLVTIEDILEELVGEISDEHEPQEPAMLKRLDEMTYEADARLYIDEVNHQLGLALPEDQGFDTLGGYVSTALGRIPQEGTTFQADGARYTVIEAEPQRVKRLKVELLPQTVEKHT
jgi:putative hemolysin